MNLLLKSQKDIPSFLFILWQFQYDDIKLHLKKKYLQISANEPAVKKPNGHFHF